MTKIIKEVAAKNKMKFYRISAVIVMTLCIFAANNIKSNAQPTITFSPSSGTTLTMQDVIITLTMSGIGDNPFHAVIENATIIGEVVFVSTQDQILSVTAESVTEIKMMAFVAQSLLTEISLPNVEIIGEGAFAGCSVLETLSLPKIESIGGGAFLGANALTSVSLGTGLTTPTIIELGETEFEETMYSAFSNFEGDISLTLGANVLPCWIPETNEWNDYIWGSITGGCQSSEGEDEFTIIVYWYIDEELVYVDTTRVPAGELDTADFTGDLCLSFIDCRDINGNLISDEPIFEVTIISDTIFVFNLESIKYNVTIGDIVPAEGGTAEVIGGNLHPCESVVTIEATPNPGYLFDKWTDLEGNEISTENPYEFRVDYSDTTFIANFKEDDGDVVMYQITLESNITDAGNLVGAGNYEENSIVSISATAIAGYIFEKWTDLEGNEISNESSYQITLVSDTTLVANFIVDDEVVLYNIRTILKIGEDIIDDIMEQKPEGYIYDFEMNEFGCYKFVNVTDIEGNIITEANVLEVIIVSDTTLIFNYSIIQYELTFGSSENGSVDLEGTFEIDCGETIEITAIPDDEHEFVNWTDNTGVVVSTANPLEIIVESDTTIIANFQYVSIKEEDIYDISVVPNPADGEFNIIFNNTDAQRISIELLDISGAKVLDIFEGFASATNHIYKVDTPLLSGTYLIKLNINGKIAVRKVIVK
ncbi:MAG: T9SS type A sorting domain-containing protein [Bacteroidetes bacterium]|nr:T9SS type A sorting domain-containing protein [Bacteroidota bacterium]